MGRGRRYLTLLSCPLDQTSLTGSGSDAHCTADSPHVYPLENGILRLLAPEDRPGAEAQSAAYELECAAQGRASPDEAAFKSLPQVNLHGYPENYWPQQAANTVQLWHFLEAIRRREGRLPVGPAGEAAVIGARMGWLAYALDVAGFTTLAVDVYAGPRFGLGVFPIARYLRVQALPNRPPLAREAFDLLVYPDGLARSGAEPDRREALRHAVRALRPGGWLAVMGVAEDRLLLEAGLRQMAAPRQRDWRAAVRGRLSRREVVIPPVSVAQKPK